MSFNHLFGKQGKVSWESPSNIALIKYWGKEAIQIPKNPSISFTLSEAKTTTQINYEVKAATGVKVSFLFEGKEETAFAARIEKFANSILKEIPVLDYLQLEIHSSNSFPHSAGIASSASSFSALALCLCQIEMDLGLLAEDDFLKKSSVIARLGSGSACRSVYAPLAIWGKSPFNQSSNQYAVEYQPKNKIFTSFMDSILIVSADEKEVGSSLGHKLMDNNRFSVVRYQQANENLALLMQAMDANDMNKFIEIVEEEALSLHALMMTSKPSFILMKPNTLIAIEKIRKYRNQSGIPVCFTLDAGPNVHVLYPAEHKEKVSVFIANELKPLCENGRVIHDYVGNGPAKLI